MNLLFCDNPLNNKRPDTDYEGEYEAAKQCGFTTHLFSFESLMQDQDIIAATRKIKPGTSLQEMIYRGWMLKPYQYVLLYETLLTKNYKLVNSPTEYLNCHYFPNSYSVIKNYTPKTIWLSVQNQQVNIEQVFKEIEIFGKVGLVVKDYVKSQKHYWETACYIPSAANKNKVQSVINRFVELQNTDLNEGLVIREFVELNELTIHSKSGMPLKQEYRLFFLNGVLVDCYNYWEEGDYSTNEQPPLGMFISIAKTIKSNFFTMDIAKTKQGDWIIVELGDGQVAGLPDKVKRIEFYERIQEIRAFK